MEGIRLIGSLEGIPGISWFVHLRGLETLSFGGSTFFKRFKDINHSADERRSLLTFICQSSGNNEKASESVFALQVGNLSGHSKIDSFSSSVVMRREERLFFSLSNFKPTFHSK